MGTLHERHRSLWVSSSEPAEFPALTGSADADVVVVGAGIAGLTTARLLADDGLSVVVIEAGSVCAGASGYTTAKITSLHGLTYARLVNDFGEDRARAYGEANEAAIELIAQLVQSDEIDCEFQRRGHVVYATDREIAGSVAREVEVATGLGLPASAVSPDELPFEVAAAVRFDKQAQFHPRRYCLGLARSILARGGRIFEHTRARHLDDRRNVVITDRGDVRATHIVVATHLPFGELGGYFGRTAARRSYAIAVEVDGPVPQDMYLSADDPLRSLRTAGEFLIVGGEGHKVGEDRDTMECYAALAAWANQHFAVRDVAHRWSAQDWVSADNVPYLGRMLGHRDNVYVATAFKKWGMTHGTVAAMIIRDLVAGHENPWTAVFDATRLAPRQSLRRVIADNVGVLTHFIGDRLARKPDGVQDLRAGAGAVVRIDGEPVAAFRDQDGRLHAVSAVCTHLGCLINFNCAEQTWDCPCHGSRFTVDGAVIEGPAVDDLETRDVG